jgi:putative glycosyltransferase (TIGR04348 family)
MRSRRLSITIVTPAPPRSRLGNRITALRWARILRELGHRVRLVQTYAGERCGVLVALHARRSHDSVVRFRADCPDTPLILALTGTDLYGDIHTDADARQSLDLADRLIVLQANGVEELPQRLRARARVIYQSVPTPAILLPPREGVFEVCVVGHLRPVKDPLRTALAARLLPDDSRIRVLQVGGALSDEAAREARAEMKRNGRYRWLGELPRWKTLRVVSRCRLLVLTSKSEGGANVVCEALACATPVISSRIAGSIGILGEDYPGYYPFGDTDALAAMLLRAERDGRFYRKLAAWCARRRKLVEPRREVASWRNLLRELLPK